VLSPVYSKYFLKWVELKSFDVVVNSSHTFPRIHELYLEILLRKLVVLHEEAIYYSKFQFTVSIQATLEEQLIRELVPYM
jgi:hypothetical protein